MISKHDRQIYFVMKALAQKLTDNVELAATWYADNKMWTVTQSEALKRFAEWLKVDA